MKIILNIRAAWLAGLVSFLFAFSAPSVEAATGAPLISQTILFSRYYLLSFSEGSFDLNATASSGLPVEYHVVSGPGVISRNTLTFTGAGMIQVAADQPGNATYSAAREVIRRIFVTLGAQTISPFPLIPDQVLGVAPLPLALPVASSGLPVTVAVISGPATLSGSTLTLTGTGTVVLVATQKGDWNYREAFRVVTSFKVTALPAISSRTSLQGTVTKRFSYQLIASGSPTSFGLTGTLPAGLIFDSTKGVISGIPTQTGTFSLTAGATSTAGTGTATLHLLIVPRVPHLFISNFATGTVGEYTTTGQTVNSVLIKGLSGPKGMVVVGDYLYVLNYDSGTLGKYTTSGDPINETLITGLSSPINLAYADGILYITNFGNSTIGAYNTVGRAIHAALIPKTQSITGFAVQGTSIYASAYATNRVFEYSTSGTLITSGLTTGLGGASGLAVSGTTLYALNLDLGTLSSFTTAGKVINRALISGLNRPYALTVQGSTLYIVNSDNNYVGAYTTAGTALNSQMIVGLHSPDGIAIDNP